MLVDCPECEHRVSDRAAACPQCGFPIAEEIAAAREREAAEADRNTRERIGDVDCAACEARGFVSEGPQDRPSAFAWCATCEHSGRVALVKSPRGYWAVADGVLDVFLCGADLEGPNVVFLGEHAPEGHRYTRPGVRHREPDGD